ncbi:MAG: TIGR03086 family metal-binding protein [Actinomycetota bacterium]
MTFPPDQQVLGIFRRGAERFTRLVSAVGERQWDLETPCEDWNVRELVNHIVRELLWVPPLFDGKTIGYVGDAFDGDNLSPDPRRAQAGAADAAVAAVEEPGALDRTVHLSYGDVPGRHYAFELSNDLWIHGWDLARAVGADEAIDDDVAEMLYQFYVPLEPGLKASGLFGQTVDPPPDSDLQTKLLAVMGRRSW